MSTSRATPVLSGAIPMFLSSGDVVLSHGEARAMLGYIDWLIRQGQKTSHAPMNYSEAKRLLTGESDA